MIGSTYTPKTAKKTSDTYIKLLLTVVHLSRH
jgi:hypothetical protein